MFDQISQVRDIGNGEWAYVPVSKDDQDEMRNLHLNQLVRNKTTTLTAEKRRSYEQLQTFWCACQTVASNTDDENWDDREKVAEQVKIKLQYIKSYMVVGNAVHIVTGSISYAAMKHMQACNFFNRAFPVLAKKIGITEDELLINVRRGDG